MIYNIIWATICKINNQYFDGVQKNAEEEIGAWFMEPTIPMLTAQKTDEKGRSQGFIAPYFLGKFRQKVNTPLIFVFQN